jgi:hypothetical protein
VNTNYGATDGLAWACRGTRDVQNRRRIGIPKNSFAGSGRIQIARAAQIAPARADTFSGFSLRPQRARSSRLLAPPPASRSLRFASVGPRLRSSRQVGAPFGRVRFARR